MIVLKGIQAGPLEHRHPLRRQQAAETGAGVVVASGRSPPPPPAAGQQGRPGAPLRRAGQHHPSPARMNRNTTAL